MRRLGRGSGKVNTEVLFFINGKLGGQILGSSSPVTCPPIPLHPIVQALGIPVNRSTLDWPCVCVGGPLEIWLGVRSWGLSGWI